MKLALLFLVATAATVGALSVESQSQFYDENCGPLVGSVVFNELFWGTAHQTKGKTLLPSACDKIVNTCGLSALRALGGNRLENWSDALCVIKKSNINGGFPEACMHFMDLLANGGKIIHKDGVSWHMYYPLNGVPKRGHRGFCSYSNYCSRGRRSAFCPENKQVWGRRKLAEIADVEEEEDIEEEVMATSQSDFNTCMLANSDCPCCCAKFAGWTVGSSNHPDCSGYSTCSAWSLGNWQDECQERRRERRSLLTETSGCS